VTKINNAAALVTVVGSVAFSPNNNPEDLLAIRRPHASATGTPIATPATPSSKASRRIIQSTSPRAAPKAIRMPTSPVRWTTAKASSPYKSVDQLKGKNLGLVDPNSTSGNNVPRFELDKMGISDADTYFGKVVFTGSHENALLALSQGTVDVAANQWTSDDDSTLAQMLHKGMLKNVDGTAMKKEDFRIIHKSAPIINGPYAYNSDLPDDLKAAIAKAFTESPTKDKVAFDRLSDGQKKGFNPATTKDWDGTIDLIKFVDNLRKKKAS